MQASHACHVSGSRFGAPDNTHLVLLICDSEMGLMDLSSRLSLLGVEHVMFYEPDPPGPGHTALCTAPLTGVDRKLFRGFSMYNHSQ